MKTIVLYGHQNATQAAYTLVDALLRESAARDVVLVQTGDVDQLTARSLRAAGAELWFCGPALGGADASWSPVAADRYLVDQRPERLVGKVLAAYSEFKAQAQRRATA